MADFLQLAARALPMFLPGRSIGYRHGGVLISLTDVTVGRSVVSGMDQDGVKWKTDLRNYLIKPADLVIDGVEIKPQEGDVITDENEGSEITYLVVADEGVAWSWTDRYHQLMRVVVRERSEATE